MRGKCRFLSAVGYVSIKSCQQRSSDWFNCEKLGNALSLEGEEEEEEHSWLA